MIGTAKPSVNAHPITTTSTGSSLARSNTAASIAPATANANATASMDTFDHAANVGRERGRESPIPVSPAMATLAGRIAASTKLCTPISWTAVPNDGAQDRVLDQPRPGRPGDRTDNRPIARRPTTAWPPRLGRSALRVQCRWPPVPSPGSTSWPAAHCSTRRTRLEPGRTTTYTSTSTATAVTAAAST